MNQQAQYQNNLIRLAIVVLIVVVVSISLGAKTNSINSSRLEYKVINVGSFAFTQQAMSQVKHKDLEHFPEIQAAQVKTIENTLNDLGKEGWELAEADSQYYIFKRRIK